MNYNNSQLEAVEHLNGPCLVLAGAGSGKTRVITGRIENMVLRKKIKPENILAVTFTNKAAQEMRERFAEALEEKAAEITCCTFHALGIRIIRENYKILGYKSGISIYTGTEQLHLIKKALNILSIPDDMFEPELLMWKLGKYKNDGLKPGEITKIDPLTSVIANIYPVYEAELKKNNAVDFNDLLNKMNLLFAEHPTILEKYQKKFEYIMVDEFQDTNIVQYKLISKLARGNNNLMVVGDDDQAIYGFRGANFENILLFDKDWPNCKVVLLDVNYRSTQMILQAADSVIINNKERKPKKVVAFNKSMEKLEYLESEEVSGEAEKTAQKIKELINEEMITLKDCAVLLRANHLTRPYEEAFRKEGLNYNVVGGQKFFDRKEVKDFLAYLNVMNNPSDEINLERIINTPKRGIGERTIFNLVSFAEQKNISLYEAVNRYQENPAIKDIHRSNIKPFVAFVNKYYEMFNSESLKLSLVFQEMIEESGYFQELAGRACSSEKEKKALESKRNNIRELVKSLQEFEEKTNKPNLKKYLQSISLLQDTDELENNDKINVMTIHSSKGLEFDTVFLGNFNEGIFPHARSIEEGNIEEERRLCYVAITRAKRKLFFTRARIRTTFDEKIVTEPSRFLKEIPEEYFSSPPSKAKELELDNVKSKNDAILAKIMAKMGK